MVVKGKTLKLANQIPNIAKIMCPVEQLSNDSISSRENELMVSWLYIYISFASREWKQLLPVNVILQDKIY